MREYKRYGDEWEAEVMKNPKSVIVEMLRVVAKERDTARSEIANYETARQEDARRLEQVKGERDAIESQLAKILVGVYVNQNDFTSEEASMVAALYWENWSDVKAAALKDAK